jgi:hypothetical protein
MPVSLHLVSPLPTSPPYEITQPPSSLAAPLSYPSEATEAKSEVTKVKPNSYHEQEKANNTKTTQSKPVKLQQLEVQVPSSNHNNNNNSINDDTTHINNDTSDNSDTEHSMRDNNLGTYSDFSNGDLAFYPDSDRLNDEHKGTLMLDNSESTTTTNSANAISPDGNSFVYDPGSGKFSNNNMESRPARRSSNAQQPTPIQLSLPLHPPRQLSC